MHTAKEAGYILYDCREYYNDGKEIADTIKRIYRTNKAVPILVLDTDNPGNEIVKECLAQQIRNFINAGLSLSLIHISLIGAALAFGAASLGKVVMGWFM